jgi:DNA-binding transcriptional ArsR family regulator
MTGIAAERMIDDITVLKALADPIRMTLLDLTMGQPERSWTARELAAEVGVLPTNIYYHLNMLERQELLVVRDTRVVNGIIEKHYGAGQRSLTFHRKPGDSADGNRALNVTMLNRVRDEMDAGLASGAMSTGRDASDSRRMMVSMSVVKIPESEIAEFREELLRMVQRYETPAREGHRFTVMAVIYPS